jgi:peptide/nickel transport system ATP-binding protein
MGDAPLLELRNVTKIFRGGGPYGGKEFKAVDEVTFSMPSEPSILALVGESGSGKTTIANMILGFLEPDGGDIYFKGESISSWLKNRPSEFRRKVQAIFQDPYEIYNPVYRIDRLLKITVKKFNLATSEAEAAELIRNALEALELRPQDVLGRYPHQLSGGERQRLMLARILLLKPELTVADEPVSMLDVSLRAVFLNYLEEFKKKYGISCLYITHDFNTAYYIADRAVVLNLGKVVEIGSMEEIIHKPLHPYTQTLISSIPIPDPKSRWEERSELRRLELKEIRPEKGCPFVLRCTHAMKKCEEVKPSLVDVGGGHMVACHLYGG